VRSSRLVPSILLLALVVSLTACGGGGDGAGESSDAPAGGGDALASLPAGCDNSDPLEVTFDGYPEVSGPLEVVGGVALPFAVLPGEGSLVEMSDDELQAAVDGSDLRAYAVAVTDFPFGPDDAGSFYGLFSTPAAPEAGGTSVIMTVLPADGPLVDGSVVDAGAELAYADELTTTAVAMTVTVESTANDDLPFLGGTPELFTGSAEIVALTDDAICVRWDSSSPVFGEDGAFLTVAGTVAAPLLPLAIRNSMG